ncbi:MAG TPA: amidohydrolase family protein [Gammaproteobacteria bacterium]
MLPRALAIAAATVLFLAALEPAAAFDSVDDERVWALEGVAVIDVRTGDVLPDRTIVVRRGIIRSIAPTSTANVPDEAIVVEQRGAYVVPGLWDMHVHIRGGSRLEGANERWLAQYLGFGVTAVRDAGGDLPDAVLRWKAAIESGEIPGPRIFTSLQKIDGPDGAWGGSIPVAASEDIAPALEELAVGGADFIKIYDGSISPRVFLEVLAEAERRGLRTAAHIPLSVPFEDAVDAGLDSVEHAFHLVKAAHPRDRAESRRFERDGIPLEFEPFFVAVAELGAKADDAQARRIFRKMAARGTALTPTLYIRTVWNGIRDYDTYQDDPRLADVPTEILATFEPGLDVLANRTAAERASDERLEAMSLHLTRLAAEEGVTILAGSDTGVSNPFAYPGDSLHHELEALVDAGLSPLQALQAATIEAATWLGKADELGTIEEGKAADLLVLGGNPLVDIRNTRAIVAVVQQGVYFDSGELAALRRGRPRE